MDARLEIHSLGDLTFSQGDRAIMGFSGPEAEAMLIYFARTGNAHSISKLAGMFSSRLDLDLAFSSLEDLVGAYVDITSETAGMNTSSQYWLDANEMEELLKDAQRQWIQNGKWTDKIVQIVGRAMKSYEGDFLEKLDLRESSGLASWVLEERGRLRWQALDVLGKVVEHYVALSAESYSGIRHPCYTGLEYVSHALLIDPLHEAMHRHNMMLLARLGERDRALAHYKRCCQVLMDKLGQQPQPATTELFQQIQSGKIKPSPGKKAKEKTVIYRAENDSSSALSDEEYLLRKNLPESSEIVKIAPEPEVEEIFCRHCKREMAVASLICEHCGQVQMKDTDAGVRDTALFERNSILILHFGGIKEPIPIQIPADGEVILGRSLSWSWQDKSQAVDLAAVGGQRSGVSRKHASLQRSGNTLTIIDLDSSNGTYLNKHRLLPHKAQTLRHGDQLRLGQLFVHVRFQRL